MLGERDILGTQLIRRNDELALLYEKVKIQQSTLSRGQIQYRDRCAALGEVASTGLRKAAAAHCMADDKGAEQHCCSVPLTCPLAPSSFGRVFVLRCGPLPSQAQRDPRAQGPAG